MTIREVMEVGILDLNILDLIITALGVLVLAGMGIMVGFAFAITLKQIKGNN